MARGVNKVILLGNLGKDPELRHTQGGNAVCNFSLAVGEKIKNGGQWVDHTEWFNVVCFGKIAENVANHLNKGSHIYLEGRITTRTWQDREGNERRTTEIVANNVIFQGSKSDQPAGRAAPQNTHDDGFDPNDDVPF